MHSRDHANSAHSPSTFKLETPRLIVRLWEKAEADALIQLSREAGIHVFSSGRYTNMSRQKALDFIQDEQRRFETHQFARWGVFDRATNQAMGFCGLFHMNDPQFKGIVAIGYRFAQKYWGNGYACECAQAALDYGFKTLGLTQISAIVDVNNHRSQRVVEKLGMNLSKIVNYQGERRQHWVASRSLSIKDLEESQDLGSDSRSTMKVTCG